MLIDFVILDVYFQCLRTDGYTKSQAEELKISSASLHHHVIELWKLKQSVLHIVGKDHPGMIKLHLIAHLCEAVLYWGSLHRGNTESYEHIHKTMTKLIWELTSKREDSQDIEMIQKTNMQLYNYYMKLVEFFSSYDRDMFEKSEFKKYLPASQPEFTEYSFITNLPSYTLKLNDKGNLYIFPNKNPVVTTISHILGYSSLSEKVFNNVVLGCIPDNFKTDIGDRVTLTVLHGLRYSGGKDTGLKDGYFYCNPHYGGSWKSRFDYVDVNIDVGEDSGDRIMTQPAQIFSIIEVQNDILKTVNYLLIVRFLRVIDPNSKPF